MRRFMHHRPAACNLRQVYQALLFLRDHGPSRVARAQAGLLLFSMEQRKLAPRAWATNRYLGHLRHPSRRRHGKQTLVYAMELGSGPLWLWLPGLRCSEHGYAIGHYLVRFGVRWKRLEGLFILDNFFNNSLDPHEYWVSLLMGFRYYSVMTRNFRLSHSLSLGLSAFFIPNPPADYDAFDDDQGFPLPSFWASPAEFWVHLFHHFWLLIDPISLHDYWLFIPYLESHLSLRFEF